mmetsp:Transcript_5062/g.11487  ORF Transcript_5062/g.11487 Transcript_5062/m.11487 type:complete len:596 (+) Transcript_5062:59-1846(+)
MAEFRKSVPSYRYNPGLESLHGTSAARRNTFGFENDGPVTKGQNLKKKSVGIGFDFVGLMFITQMVMKWVHTMTATGESFMFMGYHIPAPTMQIYTAITSLPGTLKPLLGLISDAFPIMGYTKSPYCLLISIPGLLGMYACGFSPAHPMGGGLSAFFSMGGDVKPTFSIALIVTCIFFCHLMLAMSEVFTSGVLAEKVNEMMDGQDDSTAQGAENKAKTFNLIGIFVVLGMAAGIGANFVCGHVLTHQGAPMLYLIGAAMATLLPLWVMFRGFGEPKLTPEQLVKVRKFLRGQTEVVGLTILLSLATLFMIFVPMAGGNGTLLNFIVAIGTSLVVIIAFVVHLTPVVARMLFCFFIFNACNFNLSGAMQYFCVDNKYQFPGGPNFSKMFVTFWLPLVGTFAGLLGCMVFKYIGTGFGLRQWEIMTTLFMAPALSLNVIWVYRLNLTWGISDHVWVLIESGIFSFFIALQSMPYTFAIPRMCPVGLESSMMQLLGGCVFMGGIVSEDIGALILQMADITPSGAFFEQDKFDNLAPMMLMKCVVAFCCTLAVLPLLPSASMTDKLIQNERPDAATNGSLWKRWRQKRSSGKEASATS